MLKLRTAERAELEWINTRYDEVGFVHSDFDREIIAIAEWDGQRAGLGRLVKVGENHFELGGMYILESYRGRGIAKKLVQFLLEYVQPFQVVYCIPFAHLVSLYEECGFVTCTDFALVPKELLEKYRWCKERYTDPTALLILEPTC